MYDTYKLNSSISFPCYNIRFFNEEMDIVKLNNELDNHFVKGNNYHPTSFLVSTKKTYCFILLVHYFI